MISFSFVALGHLYVPYPRNTAKRACSKSARVKRRLVCHKWFLQGPVDTQSVLLCHRGVGDIKALGGWLVAREWQNCNLNQAVRATGASVRWPGGECGLSPQLRKRKLFELCQFFYCFIFKWWEFFLEISLPRSRLSPLLSVWSFPGCAYTLGFVWADKWRSLF